jgi:hypothetical protein
MEDCLARWCRILNCCPEYPTIRLSLPEYQLICGFLVQDGLAAFSLKTAAVDDQYALEADIRRYMRKNAKNFRYGSWFSEPTKDPAKMDGFISEFVAFLLRVKNPWAKDPIAASDAATSA